MMFVISIIMFIVAPFIAWIIQWRLTGKKEFSIKSVKTLIIYFVLLNICTIIVAIFRGVDFMRWNPFSTTNSFRLKYIAFSIMIGILVALISSYIQKKEVTVAEIKRNWIRFFHDMKKYFPYAIRAAKADLRAEVANSFLDWMWWLIEPICMMLIYTIMFGIVFDASEQYFPIFIFIGITMWSFFTRGITGSVEMVRNNKGIITKVYLPKYILLFSRLLVIGFKMFVSFLVIAVMLLVFQVKVTFNALGLLPIIIVLFLFTFGIGSILMHYGVYVNDLSYITGILLTMMMYLTGTFYDVAKRIPDPFGKILENLNPVAFLIAEMRNTVLYGQVLDWKILFLWAGVSFFLIWIGTFIIYRNENSYVKVI